jgi:hypothetical protein
MKTHQVTLALLCGLSVLGCAPRQDPGIPLPDEKHPIHQNDQDEPMPKPQSPATTMPQSGDPGA